jgi:hypothetical protein
MMNQRNTIKANDHDLSLPEYIHKYYDLLIDKADQTEEVKHYISQRWHWMNNTVTWAQLTEAYNKTHLGPKYRKHEQQQAN